MYNYFSLPLLVIIDAPTKHIWFFYMKKDAIGISLVLISKVKKNFGLIFLHQALYIIHSFVLHNNANSKRVLYQSDFFLKIHRL